MAIDIGQKYQLTAVDGIGIGYGKLETGIVVQVVDILPPGEHPNPSGVEGYVVFLYLDDRTPTGEPIERLIGYGEAFFSEHFQVYVAPPPDPHPEPDPNPEPRPIPPTPVPGSEPAQIGH
ncbi:hypothetical protein GCM10010331_45010 [Streptomyces xanthochromogenes]|uniref:hypothetical protein n=1 Tax=Streptomyces xanthochromogenes TaxID=67384 RepID=UPI001671BFE0|nr:hypothetical protein [Streptomyces xanthochromogenes]GHB52420.1 hypothetical protein GCM10010331_45010 [Streptomyces xanthochromogenes]